ncbi:hypothetical protein Tco_1546776 [Tanacetum coccineum]
MFSPLIRDCLPQFLMKEAVASYADLKSEIEGFHDAAYKALSKVIQDAVKEDHALNKKVIEATKAYTKNSTNLTKLLSLIKSFDFQGLKSLVESLQASALRQDEHLAEWAKSSTSMAWNLGPRLTSIESTQVTLRSKISSLKQDSSDIKSEMKKIFKAFKGQSSSAPSSSVPTRTLAITERPTTVRVINITPPEPQVTQREGKGIVTGDEESLNKAIPTLTVVYQDPDEPIRIPYKIYWKLYNITNDEIQDYLNKEEAIKKKVEQARLLAMTKSEIIKVVYKEAEKARIDLKIILSAKGGEQFKKIQNAEHQVLKREHSQKVKKAIKLRKKRLEYERLRKIPKELGIQSALPPPAPEQTSSHLLGRKRTRMKLEPKIPILALECNMSLPEGVSIVNNMVIEEPEYGIFFIDVFGDECFQR